MRPSWRDLGTERADYDELPQLATALRVRFNEAETAKLLGGNYWRVFTASLG